FARPGTPSSRMWPWPKRPINNRSTITFCPTITLLISLVSRSTKALSLSIFSFRLEMSTESLFSIIGIYFKKGEDIYNLPTMQIEKYWDCRVKRSKKESSGNLIPLLKNLYNNYYFLFKIQGFEIYRSTRINFNVAFCKNTVT